MDVISYILSKSYVDKTVIGMGAIKGSPCTIQSITDNLDGTHNVTFAWKDNLDVTHTSVLTVKDGETPAFSSVSITGGHRLTFTTQDPTQSVSFDVMDGAKGDTGVSVVASNVDENNNLTLTLSNGNIINAGKIKAVTTVDNALSTTSSNPVENKVITNALNNKVDKEMGKGLFSDEEKAKLDNIEDGAQVNVLEKLIINGQEATITDKSIALTLITSAVSNLQNYYLKTETYTKQEVEDLIGSTVGVTIEIVEQLPAEGQSNVIYFLPTETEGVYSQYIYSNNSWILIGSTTVDLSNYYTKAQVDTLLNGKQNVLTIDSFPTPLSNNPVASGGVYTAIAQMQPQFQFANMPTASSTNLGFVYQYTGVTGTYTQNMFYRCIYDDVLGEYRWEEVIFHATVTVDSAISGTSTNPVQNKVIKEALDTKQDIMQYSTMPSAQDNLGKIVQYTGTNTVNYTNGYFYKAVYDSESDVYLWTVIKFSADMLVDNALSTTSENPVQNKVITAKINSIEAVIPSEASSTNQLVDRDSLGTASQKNFTPYVSPDNTDVPISSSVYSAITSAVYGAYHPSGSKTIAELTSDLLVLANIGNVYKITEDGVTTNLFIGGAGQTIHTGDNAVVVYGGAPNTFLFDLQSGSIDLTPYQTKALASAVEGETTVEGALGALSTAKAEKSEMTITARTGTYAGYSDVQLRQGVSGTFVTDMSAKADKVSSATAGDIATLDANGNLVDSGKTISDVVPLIRIDTTSDSATHGYYKIFDGSTVTASTREVYITGTLHNDSSIPIESSHTQIYLSVRKNKYGASFNCFVSNIPNGFDIIAVGNGTSSYGIYIKAQGAWFKARLKLTANIVGSSSEIITNPTCVASISESVQTNYSDVWSKVVTLKDREIGKYVKTVLNSAGWYKIYEGATHNQGEVLRIDLGSFYNNTQNCGHAIDIAYGYKLANISETCRDGQSVFSKIRVCYTENSGTSKNTILVYYNQNVGNGVYANILSTQNDDNGEVFNFVAVDASQYTTYREFNLGTNGTYANGVKVVTETEFNSYGITTIWTGNKTKGDTGLNFDASPYDLCFAQVGGTWCILTTGVGQGANAGKKFSTVYAGRDYVNAGTYEQYYLLDIVPDGTIATCGWFDIAAKDTQNGRLAGQKALELAIAETSTWTDPTWRKLSDVETSVSVSKIIGIKFQTKS